MTTLAEEQATGRALRCRYLRADGLRCTNEIAGQADDPVLLCARHTYEAWRQFVEAAQAAKGRSS